MKILLLLISTFVSFAAFAQDEQPASLLDNQKQTIPDSAKYFIGSLVRVCGKVESTKMLRSGLIFLNFGKPYPDQTFSAVIDSSVAPTAAYAVTLMSKNVCITCRVREVKGVPEIKVNSENQVRIQ